MLRNDWLQTTSPAFRLMVATSWVAPESWRQNQDEAIMEAIEAGPDWAEFIRLVDRHKTPALSCAALLEFGSRLPEKVENELQKQSDDCRIAAVKQSLLMGTILRAFNQLEIPVMPFKGQILSFDLYGDIGLRHSRDLDLAVTNEDLFRAKDCLESLGWVLDPTSWFQLTPRQWEKVFVHEHHLDFVHSQSGFLLELHWRDQWETPDMTRSRWKRSLPAIWQGCAIRSMSREDLVLYLCSHGGHHLWFRAKWLGDLARAHASGLVDWKATLDLGSISGQKQAVNVGLRLLNQVYGFALPDLDEETHAGVEPRHIQIPLAALADAEEPVASNSPWWLFYRLHVNRYERLLRPRVGRFANLSHLLYGREDFRTLRLPDRLFRAYALLHPFLWAWRLAWRPKGRFPVAKI